MPRTRIALIVVALLLFWAPQAKAQRPQEHSGFWWAVGLGGGVNVTTGLDGESLWGGAGVIRLGGTVSQKLLLAGDLVYWFKNYADLDVYRVNTTLAAYYYPLESRGFYLKGGVGVGSVSGVVRTTASGFTESEIAFATTVGTGIDFQVARNLYLTPGLDWLFQAFDEIAGTSTNSVLVLTLAVTSH